MKPERFSATKWVGSFAVTFSLRALRGPRGELELEASWWDRPARLTPDLHRAFDRARAEALAEIKAELQEQP